MIRNESIFEMGSRAPTVSALLDGRFRWSLGATQAECVGKYGEAMLLQCARGGVSEDAPPRGEAGKSGDSAFRGVVGRGENTKDSRYV